MEQTTAQPTGWLITKDQVKAWSACADGYRWFLEHFPQGASYCAVQAALRADKRFDDVRWLADRAFTHAMESPAAIAEITSAHKAESDALIEEATKTEAKDGSSGNDARIGSSGNGAQIGSSGNAARIGSSGYAAQIGSSGNCAQIGSSGNGAQIGSSGNGAQIGSSGYAARIGSSGYAARIGASGNDARIGSSGNDAQINVEGANAVVAVAGLRARVRTGDSGAVAVAYHDGKRTRFAVGYVGEDLKSMTWYSVDGAGQFVEVTE